MATPEVRERPGFWVFNWDEPYQISMRVDHVYRHTSGVIRCELTVASSDDPMSKNGHLLHARLSDALGVRIRADTVKALGERFNMVEWHDYVTLALEHVVRRVREGEPVVPLLDVTLDQRRRWRITPFLQEGERTFLFGYGGSLKSLLGNYLGVRVALGIDAEPGNVLVLDWESTEHQWRQRQAMIAQGLGVGEPPNLYYRRMAEPLIDDLEAVQRFVGEFDIAVVIVDSAGYACGDEPEKAAPVTGLYRAVRSLHVCPLIIGHQNRDEKSKRPYGNIYFENGARSTIQVKKGETAGGEVSIGLFNHKVNEGRPFAPFSITAKFHQFDQDHYTPGDSITFEAGPLAHIPELAKEGTATDKITAYLMDLDKPQAPSAIADGVTVPAATVRQALKRMGERGEVEIVGGLYRLTEGKGVTE